MPDTYYRLMSDNDRAHPAVFTGILNEATLLYGRHPDAWQVEQMYFDADGDLTLEQTARRAPWWTVELTWNP